MNERGWPGDSGARPGDGLHRLRGDLASRAIACAPSSTGWSRPRRACRWSSGWSRSSREVGELLERHQPDGHGGRVALLQRQRADGPGRGAGPGRDPAGLLAGGVRGLRVHAAAGQAGGGGLRQGQQGAGDGDGAGAPWPCPRRPGPTTPPTLWAWPSATPTRAACGRAWRSSEAAGRRQAEARR